MLLKILLTSNREVVLLLGGISRLFYIGGFTVKDLRVIERVLDTGSCYLRVLVY